MFRFVPFLLVACGSSSSGSTSDAATDSAATETAVVSAVISRIDVLQGSSVTVWRDGAETTARSLPIIAGREALVRVFVTGGSGAIGAHMKLNGDARDASATIDGDSKEDTLTSTINFSIPGVALTESTAIDLTIDGSPSKASAKLNAQAKGELQIAIVPFRYTADGSNRVPDLSTATLVRWNEGLANVLPVSSIKTSIQPVVDLSIKLDPKGTGFSDWLTKLLAVRKADGAKGVIYAGLASPGDSGGSFCGSGCVTALAPDTTTLSADTLGFVATMFPDSAAQDVESLAFNVGLALGRKIVGCGSMPGADTKYPHEGGKIGVLGYDRVAKKLVPTTSYDVMAYCSPKWISDYTFSAMFTRIVAINGL